MRAANLGRQGGAALFAAVFFGIVAVTVAQDARVDGIAVDSSAFPVMRATVRVFLPNGDRAEAMPGATVRVVEDTNEVLGSVSPTSVTGGTAWLFAVDQSGSMRVMLPAVVKSLTAFVDVVGPADRAALVGFDAAPVVLHAFSADRAGLRQSAERLTASGRMTELYLSLVEALKTFGALGLPTERVAIVLSDGLDEGTAYALDDVVEKMRAARVSVAAIGVGTGDRTGLLNMRRLAERTGGMYLEAGREQDLAAQVELVRRQMSALQEVAWVSTLPADGIARRVRIEVTHNGALIGTTIDVTPPLVPWWRRRDRQLQAGAVLLVALVGVGLVLRGRSKHRRTVASLEDDLYAERRRQEQLGVGLQEVKGKLEGLGAARLESHSPDRTSLGSATGKSRTVFLPTISASAAKGYRQASLTALDGPLAGAHLTLAQGRTTLGRDESNQIVLVDDRASASHAAVTFRDGRIALEDLGSTNGTFVNGARVTTTQLLVSGDSIRCATSSFRVDAEE